MASRYFLFTLLLATTACTQDPVEVSLRGAESFDRSHYANILSDLQPAAGDTQISAPAPSVAVRDLAPPTKTAAVTALKEPEHTIIAATPLKPIASSTQTTVQPITMKQAKAVPVGLMWPVSSKKVISEFGPKGSGIVSDGINIAAKEGEPVWASADGEVIYVGNQLKDYGNMIIIKHSGSKTTTYAHMGRITADKYDRVKQGDIIGYVGHTGSVKSPQLHFAVRDGNDPVDPMKYLGRNVASAE